MFNKLEEIAGIRNQVVGSVTRVEDEINIYAKGMNKSYTEMIDEIYASIPKRDVDDSKSNEENVIAYWPEYKKFQSDRVRNMLRRTSGNAPMQPERLSGGATLDDLYLTADKARR